MSKYIPVEPEKWAEMVKAMAEVTRLKAEVDALKLGSLLTAVDVLQFINLQAEVERLRLQVGTDAIDREHGMCCDSSAENARLKTEVERLIYVGDMLATMVGHCEVTGDAHRMMLELSAEWQSAKEGKQS